MTTDFKTQAEAHRTNAREADNKAHESFERSDTEGALTQWAHGQISNLERARADLAEDGNMALFPALFDLDGNMVPAKQIRTPYGLAWGFLSDEDDASSAFTGYFNPSKSLDDKRERANNAKKGYYIGTVRVKAYAETWSPSGARGMSGMLSVQTIFSREDKGWDKNAEVIDNGQ